MKTFSNFLQESFNRPYEWKWVSKSSRKHTAEFYDDNEYLYQVYFTFISSESKEVTVSFAIHESGYNIYDNTNLGFSLPVLSTVLAIMKNFIKTEEPNFVLFTGEQNSGKDKLYEKMLKKFEPILKQMGYSTLKRALFGGSVFFRIVKNGYVFGSGRI